MAGDWAQLLPEMLLSISRCLALNADYVRFRAVCVSWRASTSGHKPSHLSPQLPWLMLTQEDPNTRRVIDVSSKKIHTLHLPEARGRFCRESSHGWLIAIHEDSTICLINPLTRVQVPLPPLTSFPILRFHPSNVQYTLVPAKWNDVWYSPATMRDRFIEKAVLSANPGLTNDFVVMAIVWHFFLAFCRSGDEKWTMVYTNGSGSIKSPHKYCYEDIICFRGQFYIIEECQRIFACDVGGPSTKIKLVLRFQSFYGEYSFAKSDGELFIGWKTFTYLEESGFRVFKLQNINGQCELVEKKDIGDRMLFFKVAHLFSPRTSNFPYCCKGNCVYSTTHYALSKDSICLDFGSYNLHDDSVENLWRHSKLKPPIYGRDLAWFTPSLC